MDLIKSSIKTILENQSENGAYVACPNFHTYRFSWLRDGSFIAYSMLLQSQEESAFKFLKWVDGVVLGHKDKVENLISIIRHGDIPEDADFLPARFNLQGDENDDQWPGFQPDGYGAWLWCLSEYIEKTEDTSPLTYFSGSIDTILRYLDIVWNFACYDCWEENKYQIHFSSIACIYGGIVGINKHLDRPELSLLSGRIKSYVLKQLDEGSTIPKFIGSDSVDSNLLWLNIPFNLINANNTVFKKTVEKIENDLLFKGGVKRYLKDTYYGGGQWILLSAWMAWFYASNGRRQEALELKKWIENQADNEGHLPEQALTFTNDPSYIAVWEDRWGKVAKPLLWSHAMYLILEHSLQFPDSYSEEQILTYKENQYV